MNSGIITVKGFGPLRTKMQSDRKVTISENEPIRTVVERLPINPQTPYLFSVNGQHSDLESLLHDGDVLVIIPPISGG